MPHLPLFVYGTLLDPSVRRRVLGRTVKLTIHPVILRDHRILRIAGKPYPNAKAAPGARAPGAALYGLTPGHLARLDHYEGAEYDRVAVAVFTPSNRRIRAQIYRAVQTVEVTRHRWTLERWRGRGGRGKVTCTPP